VTGNKRLTPIAARTEGVF